MPPTDLPTLCEDTILFNLVRMCADVGRAGGSTEGGAGDVPRAGPANRAEAPGLAVPGLLAAQGMRHHSGGLGGTVADARADQLCYAGCAVRRRDLPLPALPPGSTPILLLSFSSSLFLFLGMSSTTAPGPILHCLHR